MDQKIKGILTVFSNLLVLVLGVGFLGMGMLKLVAYPDILQMFIGWQFPIWAMYLIGMLELSFAILLLIPSYRKATCVMIGILMTGAIGVHLLFHQPAYLYGPSLILMLALILFFISDPLKRT